MEISHSSFYHGVTIGSYEKLKLIWTGWFASSEHNGLSSAKGGVIWCFCKQEGWSFLQSPCVTQGMTARGCKQPSRSKKQQPRATGWTNNSFCLGTKPPSLPKSVTQHRFVPGCHEAEPSVPIVSATFPKQKPSQLLVPRSAAFAEGMENKAKSAPSHTVGVWCRWWDLASAAPSQLQLLGAAPWNKSAGTARRSCTVKWMRITAASLQCGLETRWEE